MSIKAAKNKKKKTRNRSGSASSSLSTESSFPSGGPTIFDDLKDLDRVDQGPQSDGVSETALRARDLEALLEITKAINSTHVLDEILARVMKLAIELLNAERGFLICLYVCCRYSDISWPWAA